MKLHKYYAHTHIYTRTRQDHENNTESSVGKEPNKEGSKRINLYQFFFACSLCWKKQSEHIIRTMKFWDSKPAESNQSQTNLLF